MKIFYVLFALFWVAGASDSVLNMSSSTSPEPHTTHAPNQPHWTYPNLEDYENGSAPKWGGLCDTGRAQSPINLNTRYALKGVYENLVFSNYDAEQDGVTLHNNGHTLQLSNFSSEMVLSGGGLRGEYVVEQLHLHWWSEHTINERRFSLEVHIVHRNREYPSMSLAAQHPEGIAVVAVLYHLSTTPNKVIDKILSRLDAVKRANSINKLVKLDDGFTMGSMFPGARDYFTYRGSLTTPSCAESVTWIVFLDSFPVTLEQVNRFKGVEGSSGQPVTSNYRTIQRSHNRAVVLVEEEVKGSGASAAHSNWSSFSLVIFSVIVKLMRSYQ